MFATLSRIFAFVPKGKIYAMADDPRFRRRGGGVNTKGAAPMSPNLLIIPYKLHENERYCTEGVCAYLEVQFRKTHKLKGAKKLHW